MERSGIVVADAGSRGRTEVAPGVGSGKGKGGVLPGDKKEGGQTSDAEMFHAVHDLRAIREKGGYSRPLLTHLRHRRANTGFRAILCTLQPPLGLATACGLLGGPGHASVAPIHRPRLRVSASLVLAFFFGRSRPPLHQGLFGVATDPRDRHLVRILKENVGKLVICRTKDARRERTGARRRVISSLWGRLRNGRGKCAGANDENRECDAAKGI